MSKRRLDALLAERGLYESRSRAAAAVMAGDVHVGERPASKPGELVADDADLRVAEGPAFVSRGGIKLANALDALHFDPAGRRALDAGAATGGFTDCLLQRGAQAVIALDVAYGELHWSLRQDPRVTVIERRNARRLKREELPFAPDLIVADLSFISLTKVLPAVVACAAPRLPGAGQAAVRGRSRAAVARRCGARIPGPARGSGEDRRARSRCDRGGGSRLRLLGAAGTRG
jgi:23S rRNA (cytidine1920-2'-O)/16S rRNA (cytidine1409-2'-O)-methyltransferase